MSTEPKDQEQRIEELIGGLLATGMAQADDFRPCSDEDIRRLETRYHVRLPESYQRFLRRLGRGAGSFLQDSEGRVFARYEAVLELTDVFREGFGDRVSLPDHWLCVAMLNKGHDFLFLPADGSDNDPPVYYWSEEWSERGEVAEGYASFWDWFAEEVRHEESRAPHPSGANSR